MDSLVAFLVLLFEDSPQGEPRFPLVSGAENQADLADSTMAESLTIGISFGPMSSKC